jgi:integrase
MLNLEVRDIDLINDTIEFRDCKNGENYDVDIHPKLREILAVRCEGEGPNVKVFDFKNGDEVLRQFKKVRNYLELDKKLVYHSLRHTCGTWLADRGVPVQNIAKVLGHKTLEMSMRYTHLSDKARKSAINSL